jgi:hypothetical protein
MSMGVPAHPIEKDSATLPTIGQVRATSEQQLDDLLRFRPLRPNLKFPTILSVSFAMST